MLLPQEHTVMVRQTAKWGQLLLLSLVGVGATAFATAWFYRLDEVVTVNGRLVPSKGGVAVKSPTTGQIDEILVSNGQIVGKGDILFRFDVEGAIAEKETLSEQLKIEAKRLSQSIIAIDQRISTLKRNIDLNEKILNRLIPLNENGAISELQILQQENSILSQRDEMLQLQTQKNLLINESASKQSSLKAKLVQISSRLKNEIIASPISGTVFDLKPDSPKYLAQQAESLVKIVPTGSLSGEVNISNRDIGFISSGQPVKVRIDSFPYTEYGEISGSISRVGADALPPDNLIRSYHFPVYLNLDQSYLKTRNGKEIRLQSGMTITTNLKLRDRRLIELLSDIFTDKSDSLKRLRQP